MSDDLIPDEKAGIRERVEALALLARFRPIFTVSIIVISVFAALFEGIGLGFILPIIETVRNGSGGGGVILTTFRRAYNFLGVPFELGYIVAGVSAVMALRFTMSFLVAWLRAALSARYVEYLQTETFEYAMDASVQYFDINGSDDIINAIITQAKYAGEIIQWVVRLIEQGLLTLMYFLIALYLAPVLTILTGVVLSGFLVLSRVVLESGYDVGDRVAEANEQLQETVQAGVQGIRDVKLYTLADEMTSDFRARANQLATAQIRLRRNEAAIGNFYQLVTVVTVFVLIYVALEFFELTLSELGLFLFAMFRLGPRASTLNNLIYKVEGGLPHLVYTEQFVSEMRKYGETEIDDPKPVPSPIERLQFDDVTFAYEESETVLEDISFSVDAGMFVAFVGPSGAGKSTVASLLSRMYVPDNGQLTINEEPIGDFGLADWRDHVAVVRQGPHIFDDTLWYNITIADRSVSEDEVKRVCDIAQVTEFLDELPHGFETELGDNGVRLSGGQRQRIAVARALLKDADVLVLDEATSDLDTTIEERVHSGIEAQSGDTIMIVIAHRLSTVKNADTIYTMEDGKIIESGEHEKLLDRDDKYSELYSNQH
ncbi:ABC transporter ATP-binding protein [Halosimplex amylolyticum]|uniref:ABC transporter ATP-binding protein n=1 Tax=Halosimplex amylolyticum TaxID=3396616 RepID=UPI003F56AAAA